ncbi:hypothetical protein L914_02454 [Phytophthora nicotianae]|uniref:Ubiquitin-like protease family profile domain-containing protein n=3 Tax=Phytophthora nicotianae TaxID=4792 RepID=W2P1S0_PHYNI|nr:hypothetical protein L914_02454 [Phytophthora nicotianae]
MADQNTEDFRSTFKLLQTVEKLCRAGDVRKLADALEVIKSQDYEIKRQRPEDSGVDRAKQIGFENLKFSKSVRQTQASRRKKNKAQKVQSLQRIRRRARLFASGKAKTAPSLNDMGAILSQLYCYAVAATTIPGEISTKGEEVHSQHTVQRMNVGQPRPEPTYLLPRKTCTAAISGIEMRAEGEEGNAVYLARWYDIGYATVGQLKIMVLVTDAKVAMTKVGATLAWIDSVIVNPSGVGSPFNDSPLFPKEMFKDNVENMALNSYTSAGEDIEGRLLQFRGNEWLNSTCITMNVGFIVPDWYGYQDVTARKKAAATNGAFHSSNQRQIGIVNSCGNHWIAFYLDRTSSPVTCTLFDPQQSKLRYNEIEGAVLSDIVPQLAGKPVVKFERWEKCKQEDGHSCGVWSLFFFKSKLSGHIWRNENYRLEQYYRLRYLRFCLRDTEDNVM